MDGMGGLLLNGLNGAKRLNGWNDWNVCSLRAGHSRQHRNKHQSQIQTSKILKVDLCPSFELILYPFAFILSARLHPFALIL